MQELLVMWTVRIVGWLLIGGGALLVMSALFRDRSRGRKRCPACWYDMTGAPPPGLQCPECGRTHTRESVLYRTRRRYRLALAGLLLCLVGYTGFVVRKAIVDGWTTAVPSTVIVMFWPVSEADWLDLDFAAIPTTDSMFWELHDRIEDGKLAAWQERWWAGRLKSYANQHRRFGVDAERDTLRRLRTAPFAFDREIASVDQLARQLFESSGVSMVATNLPFSPPVPPTTAPLSSLEALARTCGRLNLHSPFQRNSFDWQWQLDGPRLRVLWSLQRGLDDQLTELRTISMLPVRDVVRGAGRRWSTLQSRADPLDRHRTLDEIAAACTSLIEPDSWHHAGGTQGSFTRVGDTLIVQATPRTILQIESLLDRLRGPVDPCRPGQSDPEWTAIAEHMKKLESTPFSPASPVESVEELVGEVESLSGVRVRQDWTFISPVTLDNDAQTRLAGSGASCADALDEAIRCVTESKVFTGHWGPTPSGAVVVPDSRFLPIEIRVYDVAALLPRAAPGGLPVAPTDALNDLRQLLSMTVDPDNWVDNGGEINQSLTVGASLVVAAPARIQIEIERLLARINDQAPAPAPPEPSGPPHSGS